MYIVHLSIQTYMTKCTSMLSTNQMFNIQTEIMQKLQFQTQIMEKLERFAYPLRRLTFPHLYLNK
ncbi:unnamed protein product [Paramecium octaurelia]|uniref:Uncharacterized protein n=1 Tax=Paramecium octaurelia TaxID=43137 RepID=A0A8S1Y647_PAROT|nr:unnamed protein product [Paramecium octaurelia]